MIPNKPLGIIAVIVLALLLIGAIFQPSDNKRYDINDYEEKIQYNSIGVTVCHDIDDGMVIFFFE